MLAVFYQTLDPKKPKWQLDSSLIGSNPGKYKIMILDIFQTIANNEIEKHCSNLYL